VSRLKWEAKNGIADSLANGRNTSMNAWHKLSITEAASFLATDVEMGLSVNEAKKRLARYGQNKLRKGKRFSALVIFVSQSRQCAGNACSSLALEQAYSGLQNS